mmetsp:Transcript_34213/g.75893  ORF Transcript_34213/g.75893 Transcript_34213/m.75893 type:complete len:206 (-) Transcript_34213:1962-2579(-)
MKINFNTTIEGDIVKLVPYRKHHVDVYHVWMQDPFLQETTESEPLTMEEEYQMQASWAADEDKCTFILLDRSLPDTPGTGSHGGAMAGDVNLFFNDPDDRTTAEIEVMVAEQKSRRKGIAAQALGLFMAYATDKLGVQRFLAKILESNSASITLFDKLGFQEYKRIAIFKEVHMELIVDGEVAQQLAARAKELRYGEYDDPNPGS